MTLDQIRKGERVVIRSIPDQLVRAQAIRFGIGEGSEVVCVERLPAGPVILKKGRQEIAIGHGLAGRIVVRPLGRYLPGEVGRRAFSPSPARN